MAFIQKPSIVRRAFNPIKFRVTDDNIQIQLQYPNDQSKVVSLSGVQIDNILSMDVSGVVKYLFKDLREAIITNNSSNWLWTDYNLKADYKILDEIFTVANAVAQPGRTGTLPAVLTTRSHKNNIYNIPKYEGYPVGVCLCHNPQYATGSFIIEVSGVVISTNTGLPLPNAEVSIRPLGGDNGSAFFRVFTDEYGNYTINWIINQSDYTALNSKIDIVAQANNYDDKITTINIPDYDIAINSRINVDINLISPVHTININIPIRRSDTGALGGGGLFQIVSSDNNIILEQEFISSSNMVQWNISELDYDNLGTFYFVINNLYGYPFSCIPIAQNVTYQDALNGGLSNVIYVTPNTITTDVSQLNYVYQGGVGTITVSTNFSNKYLWSLQASIINNSSAFTITNYDSNTGIVTINTNSTVLPQTGVLRLTIYGYEFEPSALIDIQLSQAGIDPYITSTPTNINAGELANTYTVSINSNISWTASNIPTWLSLSANSGSAGNTSIVITTQTNNSVNTRTGNITITGESNLTTYTIIVIQQGLTPVSFMGIISNTSGQRINNAHISIFGSYSGAIANNIASNSNGLYLFNWVVNKDRYENNTYIDITCQVDGYVAQTKRYYIVPYNGIPIQNDFTIESSIYVDATPSIINLPGSATPSINLLIRSNGRWHISYSENGGPQTDLPPYWITGPTGNGVNSLNLDISVAENNDQYRQAIMFFTAITGNSSASIQINQTVLGRSSFLIRFTLVPRNSGIPIPNNGTINIITGVPANNNILFLLTGSGEVTINITNISESEWNNRNSYFTFTITDNNTGQAAGHGEFQVPYNYDAMVNNGTTEIGTVYID